MKNLIDEREGEKFTSRLRKIHIPARACVHKQILMQ